MLYFHNPAYTHIYIYIFNKTSTYEQIILRAFRDTSRRSPEFCFAMRLTNVRVSLTPPLDNAYRSRGDHLREDGCYSCDLIKLTAGTSAMDASGELLKASRGWLDT